MVWMMPREGIRRWRLNIDCVIEEIEEMGSLRGFEDTS